VLLLAPTSVSSRHRLSKNRWLATTKQQRGQQRQRHKRQGQERCGKDAHALGIGGNEGGYPRRCVGSQGRAWQEEKERKQARLSASQRASREWIGRRCKPAPRSTGHVVQRARQLACRGTALPHFRQHCAPRTFFAAFMRAFGAQNFPLVSPSFQNEWTVHINDQACDELRASSYNTTDTTGDFIGRFKIKCTFQRGTLKGTKLTFFLPMGWTKEQRTNGNKGKKITHYVSPSAQCSFNTTVVTHTGAELRHATTLSSQLPRRIFPQMKS
jgi:hypothetical protein